MLSLHSDDHRALFLAGFLRYSRDNLLVSHVEKLVNYVAYLDALVLAIAGKSWNKIIKDFSGIAHFCHHWSRFEAATLRPEICPQASLKGPRSSPPERVRLRLGAGRVLWWRVTFVHWLTHARYRMCTTVVSGGG